MRAFVAALFTIVITAWIPGPAFATGGTSYSWVGSGDGHSWTDTANWSPQGVPGSGDAVSIVESDGFCHHVDSAPATTLESMTLSSKFCATTLSGGALTVTGPFVWNGGQINTPLTLSGASSISGSNSSINILGASATIAGTLTLSGVADSGATNQGGLRINNPAVVTIASGATLISQGNNAIQALACCNNPARIAVAGHVSITGGDLVLHGVEYDANASTTTIAAGHTLQLDGGPSNLADAVVTGGGTLGVDGQMTASGTSTLGSGTTLALQYPWGAINGTAAIAGAGRMLWTGGRVSGHLTLRPSGGVTVSGSATKTISNIAGGTTPSTLVVSSPFTFAAGTADHLNLLDLGQSTMTVTSTTTLNAYDSIPSGSLVNTGHMVIRPGAGLSASRGGVMTTNRGTVTVASGTWNLASYTQMAGDTVIASHAAVNLPYASTPITVEKGTFGGSGTLMGSLVNVGGTVQPGGSAIGILHITGGYAQGALATLAVDLSRAAHDLLAVTGSVSFRGTIAAHTSGARLPAIRTRDTVLSGPISSYSPRCVRTSGTGSRTTHWVISHTTSSIRLMLLRGAHTHC